MIDLPNPETSAIIASNNAVAATTAKLLMGPTMEVKMSSSTGFRKFLGSTGVGFAQPSIGMCAITRPTATTQFRRDQNACSDSAVFAPAFVRWDRRAGLPSKHVRIRER